MMPERKNLLAAWRTGIKTHDAIVSPGVVVAVGASFWMSQHNQTRILEAERAQSAAARNQAQLQIQKLTTRLNILAQRQVQSANRSPEPPIRHASQPAKRVPRVVTRSDLRLNGLQGQLPQTRRELATTWEDLTKAQESLDGKIKSTRDDLNGSIARTRDEIVALQKRGEQNVRVPLDKVGADAACGTCQSLVTQHQHQTQNV